MLDDAKVSIRVKAAQLQAVMDHLDAAEALLEDSAKRQHERQPFRTRAPLTLVCRGEDRAVAYEAAPRNISPGGISLLFGGFVHPSTSCQLAVPTRSRGIVVVAGQLRWCRHVSASIHEGGLKFTDPFDVSEVIADHASTAQMSSAAAWNGLLGLIEQQATQLAALARARRPVGELAATYQTIRRCFEHEVMRPSTKDQ